MTAPVLSVEFNFTHLLLARFSLAALYLILNYLGNREHSESKKPVLNALRLFGAVCDTALVAWMLVFYIGSWLLNAHKHSFFSVSGYGYVLVYSIIMLAITLVERGNLKKAFLNAVLTMFLLSGVVIYQPHLPEGFVNIKPVLFNFYTGLLTSWWVLAIVYDAKWLTVCLSKFSQRLSPLDALFGKPDPQTMLSHVVGLHFTLLNITYVYTTDSANALNLLLLTLSALFYILLGLRHIDAYDKLTMPHGFMIHMLLIRYKHLLVLVQQFKTNALPKASAWAWITVLTFGLGSLSPCYATDNSDIKPLPTIDASLTGEVTKSQQGEASSPVAEGNRANQAARLVGRVSGSLVDGVHQRFGSLEPAYQQTYSNLGQAAQQASVSAQEFGSHNVQKFAENMYNAPANITTAGVQAVAGGIAATALASYTASQDCEISDVGEANDQTGASVEQLQNKINSLSAELLESQKERVELAEKLADEQAARAKAEAKLAEVKPAKAQCTPSVLSWYNCLSNPKTKDD